MVAMRDEAASSGITLSGEELSRNCLGEAKTKNYVRGLGNGPKPSTWLSKSKSALARQDQLQKLQQELDLIHEERRREREEEMTRREEERRRHEEEREEDRRRWEEERKHREEEQSALAQQFAEFKSFMMSQVQNTGQGSIGAG